MQSLKQWANCKELQRHILSQLCFAGGFLLTACHGIAPRAAPLPVPESSNVGSQEIQYQTYKQSQATIYTLKIPNNRRYRINTAISEQLATVESFAQKYQAIAVINGGFFDPVNQQTTSYIVAEGMLVADPTQNRRLTENPDLGPYLAKIINRSELRQYHCGSDTRYEIAFHNSALPSGCQLKFSLGGGPQLLPQPTLVEEGFIDHTDDGAVTRDPLGSNQRNARSAVGLTREGALLWVMVAQKQHSSAASGMSLDELAAFMKQLGATQALNLDGGTSSSLFYQNKVYTGKFDASEQPILRPVKSVLLLQDERSGF